MIIPSKKEMQEMTPEQLAELMAKLDRMIRNIAEIIRLKYKEEELNYGKIKKR